jgi:outer membrane protein assembly factor BamB
MTPQVGPDGVLYVAAWSPGGDDNDRISVPTFDEMLRDLDKNKNATLEDEEIPTGAVKQRFTQIDLDKDGHITRAEYENMRQVFTDARNVVLAIKPGGKGDVTRTHVLWAQKKLIPYVPSPLYYRGYLFMVKDGGHVNCLDTRTGTPTKEGRVFVDSYFSSPVAGDGKIYLVSKKGRLSVISAQPQWEVLHTARFDEEVMATPALAGGRLYLRTDKHLYCFGLQ